MPANDLVSDEKSVQIPPTFARINERSAGITRVNRRIYLDEICITVVSALSLQKISARKSRHNSR